MDLMESRQDKKFKEGAETNNFPISVNFIDIPEQRSLSSLGSKLVSCKVLEEIEAYTDLNISIQYLC